MQIILMILACLVALAALVVLLAVIIWRREIATMASVREVDGNPYLYVMNYRARYNLDDMLERNVHSYADLVSYAVSKLLKIRKVRLPLPNLGEPNAHVNCTSFQAKKAEGDGYWFGRNYDYYENPTMVTISHPRKGYASIAVTDMNFMGYSPHHLPVQFIQRLNTLCGIYAPLDGINEKGLCVSVLALPHRFASQEDLHEHKVGTSTILRLMLDRCATVKEALALLDKVDVCHDNRVTIGFHYMVADAAGDCAVFAFDPEDNWKPMVVRKPHVREHMQVTNHVLAPKYYTGQPDSSVGNVGSRSWWRYDTVDEFLGSRGGAVTLKEAQECLEKVRWMKLPVSEGLATGTQFQLVFKHLKPVMEKLHDRMYEDTEYSNVYDQQNIALYLRNWNDYEQTYCFRLG